MICKSMIFLQKGNKKIDLVARPDSIQEYRQLALDNIAQGRVGVLLLAGMTARNLDYI